MEETYYERHRDDILDRRKEDPYRGVPAATAASLRKALANCYRVILSGEPDVGHDGVFREDKIAGDFLRPEQLRSYAWALRWRNQRVGIDMAPHKRCQMNPTRFPGLRRFADVESYLRFLDGMEWEPRDGWSLTGMWRELVRIIPESAGVQIQDLYPDKREPRIEEERI